MPQTISALPSQKVCFERRLSFASLGDGGFKDLSIITGGMEAEGHGLFVDEESVDGLMAILMGKSIPGYLTHDGAVFSDRLGQEIGIFSGFFRDGMKVRAAQFNFLNSFRKYDAAAHDKLVELANTIPDQFGLSVVFSGRAVWPCADGEELDASVYPRPENCMQAIPSIRFDAVESADFVKAPAANPGGLLAKVDEAQKGMATPITQEKLNEALSAKESEVTAALSATHKTALDVLAAGHADAIAKLGEEHKAALDAAKADHEKAISELAAKLKDAEMFDIRKTGGQAPVVIALSPEASALPAMPAPAATDAGLWAQFSELLSKDEKLAAAFKAKYLPAGRALRK